MKKVFGIANETNTRRMLPTSYNLCDNVNDKDQTKTMKTKSSE